MPGPLSNINVLDMTRFQNGPSATKRFSDYGATVIKVEHPVGGDAGRGINIMSDGFDLFFQTFNRGKKSITLDLHHPEAKEVMHRLVKWADVLTNNFRPGVLERWGFGYEEMREVNPRLIYASNSGFGPVGKWAPFGCYDLVTQAYSGAMTVQGGGPSHTPMAVEWAMADEVGAMNFAFSVVAALLAREQHPQGTGQHLETSQLGAMLGFMGNGSSLTRVLHAKDGKQGDSGKRPFEENGWRQTYYQATDGKWFVVALVQEKDWLGLCKATARQDLLSFELTDSQDNRRANTVWLKAEMQRTFKGESENKNENNGNSNSNGNSDSTAGKGRTRDDWVERLQQCDVICAPILNYSEVAEEQHNWDNGYLTNIEHPEWGTETVVGHPTKFSGTIPDPPGAAPALGQHTQATLRDLLGFSEAQVRHLRASGAVAEADEHWQKKSNNKKTNKSRSRL